ncbi:uncharacterized protein LOC122661837 [Telopea speciosissima]|uniref:uncharacterized protein LOC122661837 n=1 Tax=Telopea speciosissima TaxID=54955 RepID=UPI001CC64E6B|nr:uncharacterized protein LOC122661837 [Telopea speciosissima]
MATGSSSTLATTPATISASTPFGFGGNISHILQIKLDQNNYLLWRAQFLPLFRLHRYLQYIDGSFRCPSSTVPGVPNVADPNTPQSATPNPEYITWQQQDQMLLCCLLSTLAESVFSLVIGLNTSHEKGSLSIAEYVQKAKSIAAHLAAAVQPVSNRQMVLSLLHGLGPEYDGFVTSIMSRLEPIALDDFLGILTNQEVILQSRTTEVVPATPNANVAVKETNIAPHPVNRGRGRGHGRGCGRYNSDFHGYRQRLIC